MGANFRRRSLARSVRGGQRVGVPAGLCRRGSKWSTGATRWPSRRATFIASRMSGSPSLPSPDEWENTTAYLIDAILRAVGKMTAMIGTSSIGWRAKHGPRRTRHRSRWTSCAGRRTGRRGGTHLTMEVSSHALRSESIQLRISYAVFTNLTRDHLDFMAQWKSTPPRNACCFSRRRWSSDDTKVPRWAILNADDRQPGDGSEGGARIVRYGLRKSADLRAENIRSGFQGVRSTPSIKASAKPSLLHWWASSTCRTFWRLWSRNQLRILWPKPREAWPVRAVRGDSNVSMKGSRSGGGRLRTHDDACATRSRLCANSARVA